MYTERNTDSISAHLNELKKIKLPTPQETEIMAVRALNGSVEAKEELFKSHLRMVVSIAKRYKVKEITLEDLIAEGNLALIKALKSYKTGNNFTSWARTVIQRDLIQFVSCTRHIIKCTNHTKNQGREAVGMNSFSDMRPGYDDQTYEDMLPGSTEQEEQDERNDINNNLKEVFANNLSKLKDKHREVIEKVYYQGLTYEEIGDQEGKTGDAIRQRHNKAINLLRDLLTCK